MHFFDRKIKIRFFLYFCDLKNETFFERAEVVEW